MTGGRGRRQTPKSGGRAGYDGHKRREGSKVHLAVDALGHLLALLVTPAKEQDRAQVEALAAQAQAVTYASVTMAHVDQGHSGDHPAAAVAAHGMQLAVVKQPEAKRSFELLPKRWIVECDFVWSARFRRLARDYERLPAALAELRFVAFTCLMLAQWLHFPSSLSNRRSARSTCRHIPSAERETPAA